jgi:hypothetical protein
MPLSNSSSIRPSPVVVDPVLDRRTIVHVNARPNYTRLSTHPGRIAGNRPKIVDREIPVPVQIEKIDADRVRKYHPNVSPSEFN